MTPTRQKIPDRRLCDNIRVEWSTDAGTRHFHISIGHVEGKPVEVFYSDGMRSGTDLLHNTQDACILISLLLQHGVEVEQIAKSLSGRSVVSAVAEAVKGWAE